MVFAVVIGKYSVADKTAIAARAEYYNDKNSVLISTKTPSGFRTFGYSINFDYAIRPNVLWRVEARTLRSKDNIFERRTTTTDTSSWLVTVLSIVF